MTEPETFLADTYAFIEIIRGNNNYQPYIVANLVTTKFNLIELYYYFLLNYSENIADAHLDELSKNVAVISKNSIRYGMKFKLMHKKEKLSYVDCIGYAMAAELGIKFLTGDQKFERKANVEFVK